MLYVPFNLRLSEHTKRKKMHIQSELLFIKLSYAPSTSHAFLISLHIFASKISTLVAVSSICTKDLEKIEA